jgi:photosystem II stability/assembly factor-like uncharacterized protein
MRSTVVALAAALGVGLAQGRAVAAETSLAEIRQNLFGTCLAGPDTGWMVGELGRIFRTTDGGKTWHRQAAGTARPFLAISCLDDQRAWIAGKEGMVYVTTDGGESWKKLRSSDDASTPEEKTEYRHVFALEFANDERGHGAGDWGAMIHTEDGGATWTSQQVPTDVELPEIAYDMGVEPGDVNLYGISYGDADHVWIVGEFGVILASTDGGLTWTQQKAPIESTLFGVHFNDAREGWAVGIDANILHTEDGGATWQIIQPPLRQRSLYDVFVRGDKGWIVGDSGTVLKSSDGGKTWETHELPIQLAANWIRSVWLAEGGAGFAVGSEGLVLRMQGNELERLVAPDRVRKQATPGGGA